MTGVALDSPRRGIRSDIQALRALAVLAVVFCHYFPVRAIGGFIGVDVFFVVSGFLITAHLLREIEASGRVKLSRFYARRARRLLPAAYLVLVCSLVGTLLLLPVSRWCDTAKEVFASAAYFQNWLLASKAADPLGSGASATVVRHYWSLSIEEQFYLVWPIVLVAGFALAVKLARRPRRVLGAVLLVIGGLSFWAAVVATDADLTVAYFVTYARVWEFVVGGLVAIAAPTLLRLLGRRWAVRVLLQLLGLGMIFWAIATFDTETAFPGPWAALPVLGTALVIAAGPESPRFSPMFFARAKPVQVLGDISYSIYLWHFPLYVLAPFAIGRELGTGERLVLIVVSIGLAWVTARYVEQPGRTRLLTGLSSPQFFGVLAATVAIFGLITLPVARIGGLLAEQDRASLTERSQTFCFGAGALDAECGDPFAATELLVVGPSESPRFRTPGCEKLEGSPRLMKCDFSEGDADARSVWLLGDAGVKNWKPAMLSIAQQEGWVLTMGTKGGCSVIDIGEIQANDLTRAVRCQDEAARMQEAIAQDRPDLVVVAQDSAHALAELGDSARLLREYEETAARILDQWGEAGASVAVLRDVPGTLSTSTPECLEINESSPLTCAVPRSDALPEDPFATAVEAADRPGARVIDLSDAFCDPGHCYALIGGLPVHFDSQHLSRSYSESLAPRLREQLLPLLAR